MALLSTPLKERVHSFLTEAGAPPSANLTRNYEQICVAMQRRRGDDTFWAPLTELLRDLVDSVAKAKNPNAPLPPEARLLALWDVNELAQLLRAALPHEPQPKTGVTEPSPDTQWQQLSRGLSPNVLGLLLLLGLAASACSSSDSHTGANTTGIAAGTAATGGASRLLSTGEKTGLGGVSSTAAGGSSQSGGMSGLVSNGGTVGNTGGSASVGGAALDGTAATGGGLGGSPITGGTTGLDSATTSAVTGGSGHSGGMNGPGGNGGTVSTVAGGTHGLGGNSGAVSGGSSQTGGSHSLGGNGGTVGSTGGGQATGGAALTCQKDAGSAGATAVAGYPLPSSCCVDTASALWQAIDGSTLSTSYKQTLYTCFVNLNNTWCDGLVDLFKTATPQVIANYLSDLVPCCQAMPSLLSVDFATLRQELINRTVCNVVLYKGVTFPTEFES